MPKTEDEWRKKLTPEQYRIMREKGTEAPFSGEFVHEKRQGVYTCAACGNSLFSSDTKFDSGTGWPSFDQAIPGSVRYVPDSSYGSPWPDGFGRASMERTEVVCARCGSHLGHVFDDLPRRGKAGGPTPTGKRYCINSVCLGLAEAGAGVNEKDH